MKDTISIRVSIFDTLNSHPFPYLLKIYLFIARMVMEKGQSNGIELSNSQIRKNCKISHVTVIKAVQTLKVLGFLRVHPQRNPNRPNLFILEYPMVVVPVENPIEKTIPEEDPFRAWLRNLKPELFSQIKQSYPLGCFGQSELQRYFDEHVAVMRDS